jgi:GxxExxY protein
VGLIEHPTSPVSERLIGAASEVHRHLGPGLLESSYHACLCRELELREVSYHTQVEIPLEYKEIQVAKAMSLISLLNTSSLSKSNRLTSSYRFIPHS